MLLEVAKRGFSSRVVELQDIVSSLAEDVNTPTTSRPQNVPDFCVCGQCQEMPTDKERICCKERRLCRAKSATFHNICVESENLCTAIRNMADTYVFTPTYHNRAMRHAAYRQYIMWQHGYLGKGHRKVIPSCCVWEIRKFYPSPNGHYTGYKD